MKKVSHMLRGPPRTPAKGAFLITYIPMPADPCLSYCCGHGNIRLTSCTTTNVYSGSAVRIISGTVEGEVHEWSTKEHRRSVHRTLHAGAVNSLDVSPDGDIGVSCGSDRRICLFVLGKSRKRPIYASNTAAVNSVQFSPCGSLVVSACNDKFLKLWSVSDQKLAFATSLKGHTHHVNSASFSDSEFNPRIVSCGEDETVRLWDFESRANILRLKDSHSPLLEAHFAPSSVCPDLVSSCTSDGNIIVWDIRDSQVVQRYKAHDEVVNSISFHSSQPVIVSGSDDCSARLWDLRAGKLHSTLYGHSGPVTCVRFQRPLVAEDTNYDPSSFLTASADGQLLLWNNSSCTSL